MLELVKTKIFRRQFLSFIILITFVFSGILLAITVTTRESLEKQVLMRTEISKDQVIGDLKRYLTNRVQDIKSYIISLENYSKDQIESSEIHEMLHKQLVNQDNFRSLGIIDNSGEVVNSNLTGDVSTINLSDREYFIDGMKGISTVTGFIVSKLYGDLIMIIAEPLVLNDGSRYVFFGALGSSKIQKIIENFTANDVSKVFILDEANNLVGSSYYNELLKENIPNDFNISSKAVNSLKRREGGSGIYTDILNNKVLGTYDWIDSLNIGVVVEREYNVAMTSYFSLVHIVIFIAFLVYILGICLSFLMSLQIIRPLNVIIKAVENFTDNKSESVSFEAIGIAADNELLNLVSAVNKMQSKIIEREHKLHQLIIQLKEEKKNAAEANRLKSQFLANMSHELRTPLNSIIGFTNRVLKKCEHDLPKVQYDNLQIVKSEGLHLLELINNLLDYSKIEANKMDTYIEEFNLVNVINEISDIFNVTIENSFINYETELSSDYINISSDRTKVKQILLNLISNAFKYSDTGTVKVKVTESRNNIEIRVKDQGIGISEENIDNIFDEFRQVDGSYTRKVGGTGLGLSITRKMTNLLQGTISVYSKEGEGSMFTVTLPKRYEKSLFKTDSYQEANSQGVTALNNRIVCVDDDLSMHKLYQQYLEKEDYEVTYLTGKEDVLGVIKSIKPKVVLLDIMLPNKDGWDILAHIKSDATLKGVSVVMVSVLNERRIAYHLKADDYLVKPVLRDELIDAIQKVDFEGSQEKDILIADDDFNFVSLAEQVLSEYITDIRSASDGEIAIQKITEKPPAVLLLDIMMPKYNGFEVIEFMKKNDLLSKTAVIVVTAKDLTEEEKQQLNDTADLILRKSGLNIEEIIPQILIEINKKIVKG